MDAYSAAIIGYGRMARSHAHAYQAVGVPLVAVADISAEALHVCREEMGVEHGYTDYKQMLDEVRPKLVSIVTHDPLHCQMVVDAAQHGVSGIICEKPMAMNLDEGDRMLAACREAGAILTISHQRYYIPQYAQARELIAAGAIGSVRSVEAYLGPSCIHTDGTHTIHMLLALLGTPRISHLLAQVDGHSGAVYYGHRVEDGGTASIAFEAHDFHAHLSWGHSSSDPRMPLKSKRDFHYHGFVIHGETGQIELDGDQAVDDKPILRIVRGPTVEPVELIPRKGAIAMEIEDLIHSLETGAPHPLDGQNGRAVLEAIIGIYESARQRRVVRFPVEVRDNPFLAMCESGAFPA